MVSALISFVIYIIIVGVVMWLLRYLVDNLPMDAQFKQVANVVILVIGVLILILLLLGLIGMVDVGIRPLVVTPRP